MSSKEKLVYAIIKFLHNESNSSTISEDSKESLEVARQCLETAYGIDMLRSDLDMSVNLEQLINAPPLGSDAQPQVVITEEMKAEAEILKNKGNDCMKKDKFDEAIVAYTDAILTDPNNAIYYSNRAAAYNKQQKFKEAIDDCNAALNIDPSYSKAHGRKGLALSGLGCHNEAVVCYETAIALDPSNQHFKTNLEIAQERVQAMPAAGSGFGSLLGGGGGAAPGGMPDLSALLSNPNLMNMATQMMQRPEMQQMMSSMMGGGNPAAAAGTTPGEQQPPQSEMMEQLLRTGQQMASQLQQTNPQLVEQLKNQYQGGQQPPPSGGSGST